MNAPSLFVALALCAPLSARPQSAPPAQDPNAVDPAEARTPLPLPVAFVCRRGDRAIEIDGSLVDWPELPGIDLQDLRLLSGTSNAAWRSRADCSAAAFLMWDEDFVYFAASVKDEWHRALDPETITTMETPVADSVMLTFDPQRNTRAMGPDPGRAEDAEFWLSEEPSHEVMRWDRYRGTARVLDIGRLVVSHDKELSVTTYECKIPWAEVLPLGKKPSAGVAFDLQIVVNDFDESTDPMPQTRIGWTFGCGVGADPALFGTAMLLADTGELKGELPQMPDRRIVEIDDRLRPEFWAAISRQLREQPPAVHDGKEAPEAAGGLARFEALQRLDLEISRFPRVDYVEFCQRVHRRMAREVAAAEQSSVPMFWDARMRDLLADLGGPAPKSGCEIARLPQGGWLVRGEKQAFLVDPAGADVATRLWAFTDFVLLSEPVDMTKRNDQLLLRMVEASPQRPFFAHITFHLPKLLMADMPLIVPGTEKLQSNGAVVAALGEVRNDGFVAYGMGYRVDLPGPLRLVFAGPTLRVQDLPQGRCDALFLSPRNPEWFEIATAASPGLTILDDGFQCFALPNVSRVDLRTLHQMQKQLLPLPSLLLAPGERWSLPRR